MEFCKLRNSARIISMSFVISPAMPFPNIYWAQQVLKAGDVIWDGKEYFEKLSYRNRYHIATASGLLTLSIPLEHGRDQRAVPMNEVRISYRQDWQQQHWRTLTAAYARSPYFGHYEPLLQPFFTNRYERLMEYNLATAQWLKSQLHLGYYETVAADYKKDYGQDSIDLRLMKPKHEISTGNFKPYMQVFSDRTGFLPNLSLLDLLFAEGPYAMQWLV